MYFGAGGLQIQSEGARRRQPCCYVRLGRVLGRQMGGQAEETGRECRGGGLKQRNITCVCSPLAF